MAIDMSQFHQSFFDEATEHLDNMERILLNLSIERFDQEEINAIFRAVHSIKGGSNVFGFKNLTEVSHSMESVLDNVRSGTLPLQKDMINLFLQALDMLKALLDGYKKGVETAPETVAEMIGRLKALLPESPAEEDFSFEKMKEEAAASAAPSSEDQPTGKEDPGFGFFEEEPPSPKSPAASPETKAAQREELTLPSDRRLPDSAVKRSRSNGEGASIRVGVEKVDQLINQVGELVITQAMLAQTAVKVDAAAYEQMQNGLAQLERNTRALQESVMGIRMVPVDMVFSRLHRLIHDTAGKLSKQVEVKSFGEETEMDKGLIEKLVDPMTHLVRNALDHGIETPEQRTAKGKEPKGTITLRASHQGGSVVIEVSDDGAGLNRSKILNKARERGLPISEAMSDPEVWQLIFAPGFSTAEVITDVSGRGVGMDVVKRNVESMGGRIEISSTEGRGSRFIIRLPLTLAIIEGMTVRVGREVYVVPLISIVESVRPKQAEVKTMVGKGEVLEVRGIYVPIARLHRLFGVTGDLTDPTQAVLVITESEGERMAIMVDELLGQQQVVIKSLEQNFRKVEGIAGGTILGDGQVAFILDIQGLIKLVRPEGTLVAPGSNG